MSSTITSSSSSSSSIVCVIDQCEFDSIALCQCCKRDLCINHLNEHSSQRHEKLRFLVEQIENLTNRFRQFDNDEKSETKTLNRWRDDALHLIDEFCEKKRREFSINTNDERQKQLEQMEKTINELIRKKGGSKNDIEHFTNNLQTIEEYLNHLEHVPLILPTLTIDERCVVSPKMKLNEQQLEKKIDTTSVSTQTTETTPTNSSSEQRSEKSSKKKRKSRRHSDDSSDRSSRHRSRSPHKRNGRSKQKSRSRDSNEAMSNCEDCHDCQFYQDRFGPGFMDAFGPCKCECHTWAYNQN